MENEILIASGLPRSGTSLLMQIFGSLGFELVIDEGRQADDHNPKGYYEYGPVKALCRDNSFLSDCRGKAIKIVAPLLSCLDAELAYRIVFIERDMQEIMASQYRMLNKTKDAQYDAIMKVFERDLGSIRQKLRQMPRCEVIYVQHRELIRQAGETIRQISSFLGIPDPPEAALNCVDESLYRNRL
jgi:hypothetical protein